VNEIDLQHRKLIDMINELNEAMKIGKGKDSLGKIINGLISYTATHFKTEEQFFDKFGYPDTVNHKKEHVAFVKKVTDFQDGFEKKNLAVTMEVMNFLSDWLRNHIKGTDKKYSKFFNDKGLK
jgi:hemerythrin